MPQMLLMPMNERLELMDTNTVAIEGTVVRLRGAVQVMIYDEAAAAAVADGCVQIYVSNEDEGDDGRAAYMSISALDKELQLHVRAVGQGYSIYILHQELSIVASSSLVCLLCQWAWWCNSYE